MPNKTRVEVAMELALFAHQGQKDAAGEPYIWHPFRVAEEARKRGCSEDGQCAALLHDVVEDTDVDLITIRRKFGNEVARLVDALSRRGIPNTPEEETYPNFIERVLDAGRTAVTIKKCDLDDNYYRLDGICAINPVKAERLRRKYEAAFDQIATGRAERGI